MRKVYIKNSLEISYVSALAFKRGHFQELYVGRKHIKQQQLINSL